MKHDFSKSTGKVKEHPERFNHNGVELKKVADKIWPYFEEIFKE